jgi:hypothetical protein
MVNPEGIMSENLNTGDLIDMMGARFEMVARMGGDQNDTVFFRTRMAPGKLVPLHSHINPGCFYVLDGQIEAFVVDETPKWRVVGPGPEPSACTRRETCGPQSKREDGRHRFGDEQPICRFPR